MESFFNPETYRDVPYYQTEGNIFNIQKYSLHDGPGIRTIVFFKSCPLRCRWCSNPESFESSPVLSFNKIKCIGCRHCKTVCREDAISFIENSSVRSEAGNRSERKTKYAHCPQIDRKKCTNCGACPLVCFPEALEMKGRHETVSSILSEVLKDRVFYKKSGGGITLSGGEPLNQAEFAHDLLKASKAQGLNTAIETSGYAGWDKIRLLLPYLDTVFYDCKHYDSKKHEKFTGVKNELILSNLKRLINEHSNVSVRIPVVPGVNDSAEDAEAFSKIFSEMEIKKIELLPFHQFGESKYEMLGTKYMFKGVPSLHKDDMNKLIKIFRKHKIQARAE